MQKKKMGFNKCKMRSQQNEYESIYILRVDGREFACQLRVKFIYVNFSLFAHLV